MKLIKIFIFILLILIFFVLRYFLYDKNPACFLILNANYFDSKENTYVKNKVIVLKNSLIADIVDASSVRGLNKICSTINLKGAFLFPGLIDSHTHLLATDRQRVSSWKSALELSAARPDMTRLFMGEDNAKSMLLSGFTTVRDLGNSGYFLDELLKSRISSTQSQGPDILTSGPGIAIRPSQIDLKFNLKEYTIIDENSDIDKILNDYKSHHVSWIKLYADNSDRNSIVTRDLLKSITKKVRALNLKVAIHAEYRQSIQNALSAAPNSIEHFYEIPDDIFHTSSIADPTFAVLTDISLKSCLANHIEKNCADIIESLQNRFNWLKHNNFRIVFGSDSVLDFTSDFKSRGEASLASLISLHEIGLSNLEVLRAATTTPAEMLGLPIGKIEKNYAANLVAYVSDPLLNLENLKVRTLIIFKGTPICENIKECQP